MLRTFIISLLLIFTSVFAAGQASLVESFDKLLQPYIQNNEPGGVVLVAKKGSVIYKRAFGMANMELAVPINDSMIFYIGSNTKQFTAVAILQLAEKGKINLEDTIGKYIPACPYPVSGITIQQLLSHTSGMGSNNETAAYRSIDRKGLTPAELVKYFTNLPIDFPAGTKWVYNNANFYVLGFLIEQLSGTTYAKYITDNIFKPAGMLNTHMGNEIPIVKNRPSGYLNFRFGVQNTRINTTEALYSSGGIQSTVEDMLKWNKALNSGKLLKPATLQLAYSPQKLANGKLTTYGMGFHLQDLRKSFALRHGGLVEGFTSETLYLPEEDVYVVFLLNEETFKIPIVQLTRIIASLAIDNPYSYTEIPINKNDQPQYIGVYENRSGEVINIAQKNGRLTFQRPNGNLYDLLYAGNDEFFLNINLLRVEFTRDSIGKIKILNFSQAGVGLTEWTKTTKAVLNLKEERVADSLLNLYAGNYFLPGSDTLKISKDGAGLYYTMGSHPRQMLAPENNFTFFSLKEEIRIEFIRTAGMKLPELFFITGKKKKKYIKL